MSCPTLLASIALRHAGMTWVILNLGYLPIMAWCGVNVPTTFWPRPVQLAADLLPLTHGLRGIRGILAGAPAAEVWIQLALEIAVGGGWLLLAIWSIGRVVTKGVADGSLEFGS